MASCPAPLAGNMDPAGGSKSWVSGSMLNSVMKFCVGSELVASLHGAASISPAFVTATALGHSPKGIVRAYLVPGIGQTAVRSDGKMLNIRNQEITVCCKSRSAIRRKNQTTWRSGRLFR